MARCSGRTWTDFQFSFLGPNSLTQIVNAASARSRGVETEIAWAASNALTLSGRLTAMDPKLTHPYCGLDAQGNVIQNCTLATASSPARYAPAGTQLPGTSKWKGNVVARYAFGLGELEGHAQFSYVYQSGARDDLRLLQGAALGVRPGFGTADVSFDLGRGSYSLELFMNNIFDERGQMFRFTQCGNACYFAPAHAPFPVGYNYIVLTPPRLIGLRYTQSFR